MALNDYMICSRNIKGKSNDKTFGAENAECSYLVINDGEQPHPRQCVKAKEWFTDVIALARRDVTPGEFGNVLVFVHGFNNSQDIIIKRHRRLRDDLATLGFKGVVISYDWPSGDVGAFYLEDLEDAHGAAHQLVKDGIVKLAELQQPNCEINVHILAHSMGAYVTRQAFTWADDIDEMTGKSWHVSQIMLMAGDISSRSMSAGDPRSDTLFRVSNRVTNYSNRHDSVLGLSNVKRAGVAHRVGRVGLPDEAPGRAINVDCSDYWATIPDTQQKIGDPAHSWHLGDMTFTRDILDTMSGVDREVMQTRVCKAENRFTLKRA